MKGSSLDGTSGPILTVQLPATQPLIRWLGLVIAMFVSASVLQDSIGHAIRRRQGGAIEEGGVVMAFFDLDKEVNLPTWFMTLLLASIGGLLLTWRRGLGGPNQRTWGWLVLGLTFLAMSIDEMTSLHERLVGPVRSALDIESGPLFFAWVIPLGIATLILFVVLIPFLITLPRTTLTRFLVAGFVFVAGALFLEMLGGALVSDGLGQDTIIYDTITTLEETLEMIGAALFLRALLLHRAMTLEDGDGDVVTVRESPEPSATLRPQAGSTAPMPALEASEPRGQMR
jgi:hypothetical protein